MNPEIKVPDKNEMFFSVLSCIGLNYQQSASKDWAVKYGISVSKRIA